MSDLLSFERAVPFKQNNSIPLPDWRPYPLHGELDSYRPRPGVGKEQSSGLDVGHPHYIYSQHFSRHLPGVGKLCFFGQDPKRKERILFLTPDWCRKKAVLQPVCGPSPLYKIPECSPHLTGVGKLWLYGLDPRRKERI